MIGDLVEDVVVWPRGPYRAGTDNPSTITRSRGGSAANVAAHAGPMVPTRFVGRVGDDPTGSRLCDELERRGVDVRVEVGGRTGTVVVVVDPSGERTMYADRAAAGELGAVTSTQLDGTTVLHVPAYGFATPPMCAAIIDAAAIVRQRGGEVTVDVSAASLVDEMGVAEFERILARIAPAALFANREEAEVLGLLDRTPLAGAVVVVKDGPRPATIVRAGIEPVLVPAVVVDRVDDTTGAGDAFAAGYLAARLMGSAAEEACRAGHIAASAVLMTPGAAGR